MTDRLQRLISWSEQNMSIIPWECGIFSCDGSDAREKIYDCDGIKLMSCYYYGYVDVLGLTEAEFEEYKSFLLSHEEDIEEIEDRKD